jgi:hypothetical protein
MKLNCGPTLRQRRRARRERLEQWHPYFFWRPVRFKEGDCRWLEWGQRRLSFCFGGVFADYQNKDGDVV